MKGFSVGSVASGILALMVLRGLVKNWSSYKDSIYL